jgi:hypothetical protein
MPPNPPRMGVAFGPACWFHPKCNGQIDTLNPPLVLYRMVWQRRIIWPSIVLNSKFQHTSDAHYRQFQVGEFLHHISINYKANHQNKEICHTLTQFWNTTYCLPEHVSPSKPLLHVYWHLPNRSVQIAFSGHAPVSAQSLISRNIQNEFKACSESISIVMLLFTYSSNISYNSWYSK